MSKIFKVSLWLGIFLSCVAHLAAEDIKESFRINVADFQPDRRIELDDAFDGKAVKFPAAFGIHHFGNQIGEPVIVNKNGDKAPLDGNYYKVACFHIKSSKKEKITIYLNRIFEEIGSERFTPEIGPKVVDNCPKVTPVEAEISSEWSWVSIPTNTYLRELRFELLGSEDAICDTVVFANIDDFDINAYDKETIDGFQYREPRTPFADNLFETNPLMPLREYAETVARHLGAEPRTDVFKFVDENGACIHSDGTPYFPMMIYHSCIDDWQINQTPLNIMPDGVWQVDERPNYKKYNQVGLYGDGCYEQFATYARAQDNHWNNQYAATFYIYDEPDSVYDPIALERLNKLVKVTAPQIPTFNVFCTFAVPRESYLASDYVGFDHYPIGQNTTWHSVEAIGWIVDRLRWCSVNHPVIFVVQAIPGPLGNWPNRREMACMTFTAIAHGARGIYFYTWNENGSGTMQEKNPDCYANFKEMAFLLGDMEKALIGPEVFLPWESQGEAKARVAISADRQTAYLIVANSTMHQTTLTLKPKSDSPLNDVSFSEVFNDGCAADLDSPTLAFNFEKYGVAVFEIKASGLDKLVKMSDKDVMDALQETASDINKSTAATQEQANAWLKMKDEMEKEE